MNARVQHRVRLGREPVVRKYPSKNAHAIIIVIIIIIVTISNSSRNSLFTSSVVATLQSPSSVISRNSSKT